MPIFWISPEFHNILIFVSYFKMYATVWIPNLTWLTWAVYFLDYWAKALIFKPDPTVRDNFKCLLRLFFPKLSKTMLKGYLSLLVLWVGFVVELLPLWLLFLPLLLQLLHPLYFLLSFLLLILPLLCYLLFPKNTMRNIIPVYDEEQNMLWPNTLIQESRF